MTDMFVVARSVHLITVTITIAFFLVRGVWMIRQSSLLQAKPVKILPHVNDTVLLLSALWAASMMGQYPFVDAWLTAKLLGVVVY
ncbi:MAG: SirB2 family protein, partial [Gammaproteobacteria bacterium]